MREVEIVVIGSGIGGLVFALRAARFGRVAVITKKEQPESSTNYAQGGIAAVFAEDDDPALHAQDTFVAGAGLCHPDAVRVLVGEGPARVRELMELGARFTSAGGELALGREGGHSRRRIVHAADLTGREVERALLQAVADDPRIEILENHIAVDLITAPTPSGGTRCCGVMVLPPEEEAPTPVLARCVTLATGGCGQVYRHTTNPGIATGDGIAMAYRAGARIANMEFVQFHPTALYSPAGGRTFLISEAVRGEGAVLRLRDGREFMQAYHPMASLAPRDIVARAIDREMKRSGDPFVLLDCSPISEREIRAHFPTILRETAARGIDMLREPIPVVPAAHYLCGGVLTDTRGRTSVPGLYAVGEVACTGVHGANRLASNSLLEALVFAHRAADTLAEGLPAPLHPPLDGPPVPAGGIIEGVVPVHDREEIRSLMWDLVGIVRTDERLSLAEDRIRQLAAQYERIWRDHAPTPDLVELRNLMQVALLIVLCARTRRESRGLHYNLDYPFRDNEGFLRDTILDHAPQAR